MDPVSIFNALYDTKCIKFGQFNYKSGAQSPYYINLRRLSLYPKLMDSVVSLTVERFLTREALESSSEFCSQKGIKIDKLDSQIEEGFEDDPISVLDFGQVRKLSRHLDPIICGVPYGAIPLAVAIAYKAGLPLLFERKEPKSYGDPQCFMADFTDSTRAASHEELSKVRTMQRVILIEDVICSGESILSTVRNLEKRNLQVEFVICIIDREENGINLLLEQAGVKVVSLFKVSAILRILEISGRISSDQFIKTRQWITQNQLNTVNGYSKAAKTDLESPNVEIIQNSVNPLIQVSAN